MQSLYELLKASKGLPVSDSYAALWAKKAESGIKTLTGRLPLFFRTSDTKLHDWELYGNNDVGKNLLEITAESQTINGVSFMIDKQAGTITANGIATGNLNMVIGSVYNSSNEPFNYYLSGGADDGSEQSYFIIGTTQVGTRLKRWNGTTDMRGSLSLTDNVEMQIPANETGDIRVYIRNGANADNLVFKPMLRKANTSEAFEPYKVGVGEKTKNLLEITEESQIIHGVSFIVDRNAGTVTATRVSNATSDAILAIDIPDELKGQDLYFSGCPSEGSANTYNVYTVDYVTALRAPQWDGTTLSVTDYGTSDNEVRYVENHRSQIRLRIKAEYDAQNIVFKPMLRKADTTSEFIPYGYQIPLDVRDGKTGEYNYAYDIFIGESPLTEGESISKSSTGIDIKTIADEESYPNILTTALTNKPEMMIKYKE